MNDSSPTQVVLLTPPGRAAIATMAIEGPEAISIVEAEFQSADGLSLRDAPPGKLFFGRWNQGQGEEVVVCCRSVGLVELSCHGGTTAAASIIRTLVAAGCKSIPWPDWIGTKTPTPIQAQAHIALSQATTRKTATILLDQYAGALDRALDQARAAILQQNLPGALQQLTSLLEFQQLGRHLVTPWRVVLAGRPNVGKSSLINALLGFRRAIVFDQPGTTRDAVSAHTALDGWPIELTDTAGLRDATCELESAGVELARETLQTADLVVLVFEAPAEWTGAQRKLVQAWPQALCVHNKSDLLQGRSPSQEGLRTSTLTGDGIDDLVAAIIRKLVPRTPPQGAAVPFLPEHLEMIDKARDALIAGEPQAALDALQSLTRPTKC